MFSNRDTGLVIEFYQHRPIGNNPKWTLSGLIGWSVVRLDARTQNALISTAAVNGMRTEGREIIRSNHISFE